MERGLRDIADTLENGKRQGRGCSLLIGAGCSATAGVPLASGFVREIEKRFRSAFDRAKVKDYPNCMSVLYRGQRRDLIHEFVSAAKINWCHVAIAQLMKAGYVDRILTTNFDPLIMRACAAVDVFPSIYDFAVSQLFQPAEVLGDAVFHLHGQYSGFILLNTEDEMEDNSAKLAPVFEDAGRGRSWIVAGYSGESDPVFEHLARVPYFPYGLYWVGYGDGEAPRHVRERLLEGGKDAYFVRGFDADRFFVELARELGCFPPPYVAAPFSFLRDKLSDLVPFTLGQSGQKDHLTETRNIIQEAIETYEADSGRESEISEVTPTSTAAMIAQSLLFEGAYDQLVGLLDDLPEKQVRELAEPIAWALVMQGNELYLEATKAADDEAAHRLFLEAGEKYQAALELKPDFSEALFNWGSALYDEAETKKGEAALELYREAGGRFERALAINPEFHEALFNWGNALWGQAISTSGEEAERFFDEADEKYRRALDIKRSSEVLFNWGSALADRADAVRGDEADRLYAEAGDRYREALELAPESPETLSGWGLALTERAALASGGSAARLYDEAEEKFARALEIQPAYHEALTNWGYSLLRRAEAAPERREELFGRAEDLLDRAEKMSAGAGAYNLACVAGRRGHAEACRRWLLAAAASRTLPDRGQISKSPSFAGFRGEPWFEEILGRAPESPGVVPE